MLCFGILMGVIFTLILTNKFDLLSINKGDVVTLKDNLVIAENDGVKLTLPKGTKLNFISQYDDVGEFSLGVVITDLSVVEDTDGFSKYFSEQSEGEK